MRVTNNLLFDRLMRIHREVMESLERASYKLSSGKRLEYPSDAPSDTSQILALKRSIGEMERFLRSMDEADTWLKSTDGAFEKLDRYIERVKELALTGANDTQDADSRESIAHELSQIFDELVDIGNTKVMDKYIFAGTDTARKPFAYNEANLIKVGGISSEIASTVKVEASEAFSDLYQFDSGEYRVFLRREGDGIAIWVEDALGRRVQIDSNGSDDSGIGSNHFVDMAVFKPSVLGGKIYGTFDTGRGIRISFNGTDITSLNEPKVITLSYTKGGGIAYTGNNQEQKAQIGYDNFVAVNVPGEGVFKPTRRLLAAQSFAGVPFYDSLPLDRLGLATGEGFEISGTLHNGSIVASPYVVAGKAVDFQGLGTGTGSVVLKFYVNEGGTIVSSDISFSLPAHYESMDEVVDVIKAQLDANGLLRDRVEVTAEGDHLAFYLLDPGANYLYVKEEGTDYLGFGDGLGSWGMDPRYTVMQRVRGRAIGGIASSNLTISLASGVSAKVSVSRTDITPLYTYNSISPRLFAPITGGTTVTVEVSGVGTYTWNAGSDISTLDELVREWNDPARWSSPGGGAPVPPLAMVKESENSYRLVSLEDTGEVVFSATVSGSEPNALYLLGLSGVDSSSVDYTLKYDPSLISSGEYTALRLAYAINRDAGSLNVVARTDGRGEVEIYSTAGAFNVSFDPSSPLTAIFPHFDIDGSKAVVGSDVDTLKDLMNRVEDIFRHHIRAFTRNGAIYFEDRLGGESLFDVSIKALPGTKNVFSSFYVAREGEGVDLFRIIKNLEEANRENIPRRFVDRPTQWKSQIDNEVIQTTILPMTSGKFRGDYNTTWTVRADVIRGTVVKTDGYTSFFARSEFVAATSSVTLNAPSGEGEFVLVLDNNEKVEVSATAAITLDAGPGSSFRIFLEEGNYTLNSSAGTLTIDGKVDVVVEDGKATYDGYSNIKYVTYEGVLTINVSPNMIARAPDKTNLLITVEDSKGKVVKRMVVDQPLREYYVRDGVFLSFGSGHIKAGDTFEVKVGGGIEENVGKLDEAYQQVLGKRTEVGARMEAIKMARNRYEVYKQKALEAKAPLEDSDIAEATIELQKAQMALRAALMASVRLFTPTIMDFLR